jgi:zinc finger protein
MIAHVSEIPYFGEHTQLTILCDSCGWKHTDFIPAEGSKPGGWSLKVNSPEHMSARVVRSSSCTVRLVELNLEASPGNASSGYISNIEGVFNRFVDVIRMLMRQAEDDGTTKRCEDLLNEIEMISSGQGSVELVLLDPMGHSQILHDDANPRNLSDDELSKLQTGPSVPVFDADDL